MTPLRRGYVLLDALVGASLLAVLIVVAVQMIAATTTARRAVEGRAIALELAAGSIERVAALPWDAISPERLRQVAEQTPIEKILPGATLTVSLDEETTAEGPAVRHVRAEVAWSGDAGRARAPVRLDYWAFAPAGGSP